MRLVLTASLLLLLLAPFRSLRAQPLPPTKPDSMLQVLSSSCKWAKLTWRRGNGQQRIVVLADDPGRQTTAPLQGTPYTGSEYFMAGSYVQNGGFAVFVGNATTLTLRQLQPNHNYRALVYGFNADSRGRVAYKLNRIPDTLRFTTPSCPDVTPTQTASNLRATTIDCSTFRITCHPGNGQQRLFVIRKSSQATTGTSAGDVSVQQQQPYFASNLYARGFPINPGLYGIYAGADSTVVVYGLAPSQIYKLAVYEFNTVPGPEGFPDGVTPFYTQSNYPIFYPATGACTGSEPAKSAVDDQQHQTSNARVVANSLSASSVTLNWHPSATPAHYVSDANGQPVLVPLAQTPDDGVGNYVVIRNALSFGALPLPLQNTVPARVSSVYGKGSGVRPGQDSIYSVKLTQVWSDTTVTITGLRPSTPYTADVFTFRYPDSGGFAPYTYFLSAPQASVSFFTPAQPLPVQLVSFTAQHGAGQAQVQLAWTTATELNCQGFEVERSRDGASWAQVGYVAGQGTSATATSYTLASPYVGGAYYRLRQVDTDGSAAYSPVRVVAGSEAADGFRAYPNPTRGEVQLAGVVPTEPVQVFNLLGQCVLTIPAGQTAAQLGGQLPAGMYVLRQLAQYCRLEVR